MTNIKPKLLESNKGLSAFVREVTATLLDGGRHQTPGLGTFSTCTRKATATRAACKMAMFRASAELREYATGGSHPLVTGPHIEVVNKVIEAMITGPGVEIPGLGLMAVVQDSGKKQRLIFHGADELNEVIATS